MSRLLKDQICNNQVQKNIKNQSSDTIYGFIRQGFTKSAQNDESSIKDLSQKQTYLKLNNADRKFQQFQKVQQGQIAINSQNEDCKQENFKNDMLKKLLLLQQKWISKENEIKQYIQKLKRIIEEKNDQIYNKESQNSLLSQKLAFVESQKTQILEKLNSIQDSMNIFKKQNQDKTYSQQSVLKNIEKSSKNQVSDKQKSNRFRNSVQFQQILTNNTQKNDLSNLKKEDFDSQKLQNNIMSKMMKLFEENIYFYKNSESDKSSQYKQAQQAFIKKDRQIRVTTTTEDTSHNKLSNSLKKKKLNGKDTVTQSDQQKLSLNEINPKINKKSYKSAKTITFSRDQEVTEHPQLQKNMFFSSNQIPYHLRDSSQISISPQVSYKIASKTSQQSIFKKQHKQMQEDQLENTNQPQINTFCSQNQGKKSKGKKKSKYMNSDYSLSSSLVSASQIDNASSFEPNLFNVQKQQKLEDHKKNGASKNCQTSFQRIKNSNEKIKDLKTEQISFETNQIQPQTVKQPFKRKEEQKPSLDKQSQQDFRKKTQSPSMNSLTVSSQFKPTESNNKKHRRQKTDLEILKQNLDIHIISKPESTIQKQQQKQNLQRKKQLGFNNVHSISLHNEETKNTKKVQQIPELKENLRNQNTHKKTPFMIQRESQRSSDSIKQSDVSSKNEYPCKSDEFLAPENANISKELKRNLFGKSFQNETQCQSFQDKSVGNSSSQNFFFKSVSSDTPFKNMKLKDTLNQQKSVQCNFFEQQKQPIKKSNQNMKVNIDKLLFQNQAMRSYNATLQKQTQKMTKTSKLIEKFNAQNNSILSKISRKSIY